MKKLLFIIASVLVFTGCLSIGRVPFPAHEEFSDDGVCTNREWQVLFNEPGFRKECWTVYPTIYMRCFATGMIFSPIDYTKKGEDLYKEKHKYWAAIPLTILWLTSPVDAVIDTVFLPYDLLKE